MIRTIPAKLLIAGAAATVGLGLTIAERVAAQSLKADAPSPAFDAASLKLDNTPFGPAIANIGGPGTDDPGRITYNRINLPKLVTTAWNIEPYQVAGPAWLKPDQWYALIATMPPDTTKDQLHLMLQNLMIERFHMRVHRETRSLPGYELVAAPGGPKLKETTQDPDAPPGRISGITADGFPALGPGRGAMSAISKDGTHFKAQACTIEEFLTYLRGFVTATVETGFGPLTDKTGLTGRYDFTLQFDGSNAPRPVVGRNVSTPADSSPDAVADPSGAPGLLTALQKQLGLKLVRVKSVPVEMLVIDYMDKAPAPN